MGELGRASVLDVIGAVRRHSVATCFDRSEDVGGGLATKDWKTRRSVDGGNVVSGRGVPDIVRTTRYDVATSNRDEDSRKRRRRNVDQSSELFAVPHKRISRASGSDDACRCNKRSK